MEVIIEALRLLCLGGAGVARLADFYIHALYISHARLAARVRVFMDFLAERVSLPE